MSLKNLIGFNKRATTHQEIIWTEVIMKIQVDQSVVLNVFSKSQQQKTLCLIDD